jgi:hypothetical protein
MIEELLNSPFRSIIPVGSDATFRGLSILEATAKAPSIGSSRAMASLSARYQFMPTFQALEALMAAGWVIISVKQQTVRKPDRSGYQRHQIGLYHPGLILNNLSMVMDVKAYPMIYLTNSHDGLQAWQIDFGLYRLICGNGLVTSSLQLGDTIRHRRSFEDALAITEASQTSSVRLFDDISMMRSSVLDEHDIHLIASRAIAARWEEDNPIRLNIPNLESIISTSRRPEDSSNDAWSVLNRIQENCVRGGWGYDRTWSRRRMGLATPIREIRRNLTVNKEIWGATWELVESRAMRIAA